MASLPFICDVLGIYEEFDLGCKLSAKFCFSLSKPVFIFILTILTLIRFTILTFLPQTTLLYYLLFQPLLIIPTIIHHLSRLIHTIPLPFII